MLTHTLIGRVWIWPDAVLKTMHMRGYFNTTGTFRCFKRYSFSWFQIIKGEVFRFKNLFIVLDIIYTIRPPVSSMTCELLVRVTGKLDIPPNTPGTDTGLAARLI